MSDPTGQITPPEKPMVFFEPTNILRSGKPDQIKKRLAVTTGKMYGEYTDTPEMLEKLKTIGTFGPFLTARNRVDKDGNYTNLREFQDVSKDLKTEAENIKEIIEHITEILQSPGITQEDKSKQAEALAIAESRVQELQEKLELLLEAKSGKVSNVEHFANILEEHTTERTREAISGKPSTKKREVLDQVMKVGGEILKKKIETASTSAPILPPASAPQTPTTPPSATVLPPSTPIVGPSSTTPAAPVNPPATPSPAPVPPAIPPTTPTTPASPPSAPLPASALKSPATPPAAPNIERLREYDSWPSGIHHRKGSKGQPAGWFSERTLRLLPDPEKWTVEKNAWDMVWKKYHDFIRGFSYEDKRLVKQLIAAKNKVVDAIKSEDINLVEILREEFDQALDEWKERWKTVEEIKKEERVFAVAKKSAKKLSDGYKQKLQEGEDKVANFIAEMRKTVSEKELDTDELETLHKLVEAYVEEVKKYETKGGGKLKEILRPIAVTDKNKNQTIRLIDGRTITLEKWQEEESERTGRKTAVDDIEKSRAVSETKKHYEAAFQRDEKGFVSLYALPSLDTATNTITYTANDTLRIHPAKDIILSVLADHGITMRNPSRDEVIKKREEEKHNENLKRTETSYVYSPRLDPGRHGFNNNARKFFSMETKDNGVSQIGGMVEVGKIKNAPHASENIRVESLVEAENRFNDLREKAHRVIDQSIDRQVLAQLGILEHEMEAYLHFAKQDAGNKNEKSSHQKLISATNEYERQVEKFLEKKIKLSVPAAPEDIEKARKKKESLAKIQGILDSYKKWNTAKREAPKSNQNLSWLVFTLILATSGSLMFKKQMEANEAAAVASSSAPKIEAQIQIKKLGDYVRESAQKLLKDLATLSIEDLSAQYAKLYVNRANPSSLENFLSLDAYKVLHEPGIAGLGEQQQLEISKFLGDLENISKAIDSLEKDIAQRKGLPAVGSGGWEIIPGLTVHEYALEVRGKIKQIAS